MDSTPSAPAERRSAHRRVGAAAIAAFLALLLLAAVRGPAEAAPTSTPATTPNLPGGAAPQDDDGFRGRRDGFGGPRGGGGGGRGDGDGGGFGGPGGGQTAPAPTTPSEPSTPTTPDTSAGTQT